MLESICGHVRLYNPRTGRFLQKDPIGFRGNDENIYRYVKNSPVAHKDPSGLFTGDILATVSTPQGQLLFSIVEGAAGSMLVRAGLELGKASPRASVLLTVGGIALVVDSLDNVNKSIGRIFGKLTLTQIEDLLNTSGNRFVCSK